MKWQYKGEWFETIPIKWERFDSLNSYGQGLVSNIRNIYPNVVLIPCKYCMYYIFENYKDILVYVPKHDKCYTIQRFGVMGNGNQLKMCLEDIYTKKDIYVKAKNVELVVKCND